MIEILLQNSPLDEVGNADFITYFNSFVSVVVIGALLKGWIVTGRERAELAKERDLARIEREKLEEALQHYQERMTEEILPRLWDNARILEKVAELFEDTS